MSVGKKHSLTETEKKLIRHLKERGESFDTILAICHFCKTEPAMAEYLAWLKAHPQAGHDELFCHAIDAYTDIIRPRRLKRYS